jgi:hypothetical protein
MEDDVIDVWFRLQNEMWTGPEPQASSALRPPSLRDAIYAWALSRRTGIGTTPETIESYVNGLESGAMLALFDAWGKRMVEVHKPPNERVIDDVWIGLSEDPDGHN